MGTAHFGLIIPRKLAPLLRYFVSMISHLHPWLLFSEDENSDLSLQIEHASIG